MIKSLALVLCYSIRVTANDPPHALLYEPLGKTGVSIGCRKIRMEYLSTRVDQPEVGILETLHSRDFLQ